ncbi:ankyrin-1-like [Daphnia carinata]|uniref:ankyrin-1-like n=1 Tax=Daphnia carinata TaxID=120202 RepID=UPI00286880B5|nr:ankyrin-1-like [Daphnia carinata]
MKYPEIHETSQEAKKEIIRTAAKCNISPAIWSELLEWAEKHIPRLLREVVQSHVSNAPKIADMILQKHCFTENKFSSFHLAAFNEGNYADKIMQALFDSKRILTVTDSGLTPAHIAAQNESNCGSRLMKVLLDNGADPNARFQDGTTPVHWAATNQGKHAVDILKLLLDHGGDVDKIDENGFKPIHYATMNTSDSAPKLLDLLLEKRSACIVESTGSTLLHLAVLNNGGCAQDIILLQMSGDPNAVDQSGWTPVHYAAASENDYAHEKLKLLLACNGNLTIQDNDGFTPIHCAIINKGKCGDEMRKLVGVNPEKTNAYLNSNGETLLHCLVSKNDGKLDHVQMVIQNGGNPNATDKFGRSPVHSVVISNESLVGLDMLRLLLANGGNVNLQDYENQFTPVHYAASSLKLRVPEKMKILLNSGGDVNKQGNDGITPLRLAVANSGIYGPLVTRMLLEFGADVNAIDVNQQTPLHEAIRNENDDIRFDAIQQLIEKDANPNARDSNGWTPMHYAVQYRKRASAKVVEFLLQHGGNMNIADNGGGIAFNTVYWLLILLISFIILYLLRWKPNYRLLTERLDGLEDLPPPVKRASHWVHLLNFSIDEEAIGTDGTTFLWFQYRLIQIEFLRMALGIVLIIMHFHSDKLGEWPNKTLRSTGLYNSGVNGTHGVICSAILTVLIWLMRKQGQHRCIRSLASHDGNSNSSICNRRWLMITGLPLTTTVDSLLEYLMCTFESSFSKGINREKIVMAHDLSQLLPVIDRLDFIRNVKLQINGKMEEMLTMEKDKIINT